MQYSKCNSPKQAKAFAKYRPLPGWPKTPTLELALRQQRAEIVTAQTRYEAALAKNRNMRGCENG